MTHDIQLKKTQINLFISNIAFNIIKLPLNSIILGLWWLKKLNPNIGIYLTIDLHPKCLFNEHSLKQKCFFASNKNWYTIHDLCDPNKKSLR